MTNIKFTTFVDDKKISLDVLKSFNKQINKVEKMFDIKLNNINLILVTDHKHLCKITKKARPLWGVSTNIKNTIFVYNPKEWDILTTGHSYEDLDASISHQIVHIFFKQLKIKTPVWFEEGLATFVGYKNLNKKRHSDYLRLSKIYGVPSILTENTAFSQTEIPALRYLTSEKFVDFLYRSKSIKFLHAIKRIKNGTFVRKIETLYNKRIEELWNDFIKNE